MFVQPCTAISTQADVLKQAQKCGGGKTVHGLPNLCYFLMFVWLIVFNATFNNISVI